VGVLARLLHQLVVTPVLATLLDPLFELVGFGAEGVIRKRLQWLLEGVDFREQTDPEALDLPIILGPDQFFDDKADHLDFSKTDADATGTQAQRQNLFPSGSGKMWKNELGLRSSLD
jgi:hypothetical protein